MCFASIGLTTRNRGVEIKGSTDNQDACGVSVHNFVACNSSLFIYIVLYAVVKTLYAVVCLCCSKGFPSVFFMAPVCASYLFVRVLVCAV